jgi:Apg6 BARA domain
LQTLDSTTLAHAQQWNVTASDAFYIACEHGTVATINGLRLGAESVPAAVMNSSSEITPSTTHNFFPFAAASTPETATLKIPWREINAALGQVALLLATLEQNLSITTITSNNSTTKPVFRYELQCMGSTSKIGLRRPAAATAFYNLYYEPEAFQFFAKRNFNTALQCLLECVQDAAVVIQERDPTIVLPYAIQHTKRSVGGGGSTTVGGLSLSFFAANDTNDAQQHAAEWTRACKYLLTNMKHLMVFRAVGLWTNRQL